MTSREQTVLACAALTVLALSGSASAGPIIVVDFLQASEGQQSGVVTDQGTPVLGAFDLTPWGFAASDYDLVTSAIMVELNEDYLEIPTHSEDSRSPIPDGQQLDITFTTGTLSYDPGGSDYYYVLVGRCVGTCISGALGVGYMDAVRTASGAAATWGYGYVVADVFTNALNALGGLTPGNALRSGNLTYTANVIAGTLAHEIGHNLSLEHDYVSGAVTVNGNAPIMGTGALGMQNQDRLENRSFAYTANVQGGGQQYDVQQLVGALGLRDDPSVPEPVTFTLAGAGLVAIFFWRRRP